MTRFAILCLVMLCTGCASSRSQGQTATVREERRQGVEAGQPVNVTTTTSERTIEQTQATSTVDVSAAVQAAVAGLRGDLPGLIKAAMPVTDPAGIDWQSILAGGAATVLGGGYGMMKHREAKRERTDADLAWERNQRALALLPPEQARQVLDGQG